MHSYFEIATLPGFFLGMGALDFACGFPGEALGGTVSMIPPPAALSSNKSQGLNGWVIAKPYGKIMSSKLKTAFKKKFSAQSVLVKLEEPEPCVQSQNLTVAGIAAAWRRSRAGGAMWWMHTNTPGGAAGQGLPWWGAMCQMSGYPLWDGQHSLGESWRVRVRREVSDGVMMVVHCRPTRRGKGLKCRSEFNIFH